MNARQKAKKYKKELEAIKKIRPRIIENRYNVETFRVEKIIPSYIPIEHVKHETTLELGTCLENNNYIDWEITEDYNPNYKRITGTIRIAKGDI